VDGLAVTLRPVGEALDAGSFAHLKAFQQCAAEADEGQRPRIKAQWLRRLRAPA
jgi:hypothetical protein